ncbi:MAG: hypothetical protein KKA73_29310 [Chloroflexi bacterium]|nr:hypothetical protein [Chloroflexota bacterium]MBU1751795.1 hypothetical protein [Chloroflexota bacterium]
MPEDDWPSDLPSDNWRIVTDAQGRQALLYLVRFISGSKSGEPRRIPNEPTALPRLADLHRERGLSVGPFIALAEVSDATASPDVVSIRVWNVAGRLAPSSPRLRVADLSRPKFDSERQ